MKRFMGWLGLCALLGLTGCDELDPSYGEATGRGGNALNGTRVLAEMLGQSGVLVASKSTLSPSLLEQGNVIIWFPNDIRPPSEQVREWFDEWLDEYPDRMVIYIGRDYDAQIDYWESLADREPNDSSDKAEMRRNAELVAGGLSGLRLVAQKFSTGGDEPPHWFKPDYAHSPQRVTTLQGESGWGDGVDIQRARITLATRLVPPDDATIVLTADGEPFISHFARQSGTIMLVANGSFLLNGALVNAEHRRLAAQLVSLIPPGNEVFFLESDPNGPQILDEDEPPQASSLRLLTVPPFDMIFSHWAVVGVALIFARWMIVGVPRRWVTESAGDFGRHVAAIGNLLLSTRDRDYAESRMRHYHQLTRGESPSQAPSGPDDSTPSSQGP